MDEHVHEMNNVDIWEHEGTWYLGLPNQLPISFASRETIEWVAKLYLTTERYQELIMAVGNKHEGETRHETALRYILEAERGSDIAADILEGKDNRPPAGKGG